VDQSAEQNRNMKKNFLLLLLFSPTLVPTYHISTIERKDGVVHQSTSTIQKEKIFEEVITLDLEGLPSLVLKKLLKPEVDAVQMGGENVVHYNYDLSLLAKEQIIPLDETEAGQTVWLKPFGIQELKFVGAGEAWITEGKKTLVAEQFNLSGEVLKGEDKHRWTIEYALGVQK